MSAQDVQTTKASASVPSPNWKRLRSRLSNAGIATLSVLAGLLLWHVVSLFISPLFLPSPKITLAGFIELAKDGTLWASIVASSIRIFSGWVLGVVIGIPLGIAMGSIKIIRQFFDPYIEFFRFIPPIAFVTLSVIWLGPGEASKVALIFYTTVFTVTLNALAGTLAVPDLRIKAAASLGATKLQTLLTIVVPSTVPYMITGARIAMGNSFLTIVSAEIIAADEGLGALIWNARNYGRTEWVFVGIITLGWMGLLFDRLLRVVATRLLKRYGISL
jgi:ABC-type nitrate/sulfonate/bicarbonate transport system permease component